MQFSVCIGLKVHVYASHVLSHGKDIDILLSCPSCTVQSVSVVGKTKRPLGVRNIARVGTLEIEDQTLPQREGPIDLLEGYTGRGSASQSPRFSVQGR